MSKRASSSNDKQTSKRVRIDEGESQYDIINFIIHKCNTGSQKAPLADERAWKFLEQFLTTDMTYSQMEEALLSYLGDRYSADDWKEARDALFSGDGNDSIALGNLRAVKAKHLPQASSSSANGSSVSTSALRTDGRSSSTRVQQSRRRPKVSHISCLITFDTKQHK